MQARTQGTLPGEFLKSEANGRLSRERIKVAAGNALPAGQVLGKLDSGEYVAYNAAGADGSEKAVAILYAPLDASDVARPAVGIVRLAEVVGSLVAGADAAAFASLATHFVIPR
ncbi:head decoration protein [Pandoraea sp. ISTKB]|uniref:head decoration protein n=1 Tax=Pandoraea sp. ISTKB TaxID=1586708 RepID=UPI0008475D24|nr:head decoration protein [Pandoraea sp. ISTKB]ODP33079.1 hypothetical protein A9762_20770 [Pandoraea sp. ISTKB]